MQDYRININYAKALYLLAEDTHEQDRVAEDMRLVHQVCAENRILNVIFSNPEVKSSKKADIITDLYSQHVCKTTMAFLIFVVRKKRSVNLRGISDAYINLYRESHGIVLSQFTTADPADEAAKAIVTKAVAEYTHKTVELKTKEDPNIIGGFALEFDNTMYDARISTYLAKMRRGFEQNSYESKL